MNPLPHPVRRIVSQSLAAVLLCASASLLSAQTVWNGLQSYYSFADGTGTTLTDAVNGADGTLVNFTGSPWSTISGPLGGALAFDGSNDYVQVLNPLAPLGDSPRTLAGWVYSSNGGDNQAFVTYGQRNPNELNALTSYYGAKYFFAGHAHDVNTGISVPAGQWVYLAETFDGATLQIYLNGTPYVTASSFILNTSANTSGLLFGAHVQTSGDASYMFFLNGALEGWGIWDRALDASEISQLYNDGNGLAYSDVPEPATCTVIGGLLAFGLACWQARRR